MISIIIVNYHVKKELFACIKSIFESKTRTTFEIIVVDNDETKTIQSDLKKKFPKAKYIVNTNKGFGQGNNVGAKQAKGEYLFFLNPDTKVYPKAIDELRSYLDKNKKVGIVAPLLYDNEDNLYPQGAKELTPTTAVFTSSFVHKFFPNNIFARKYWLVDQWDKKSPKEVDVVPGTAFLIRKNIYKKLNGFDEKFFMYFEEHDLCIRVRKLGWKIIMYPPAKVYHALGRSSSQVKGINRVFMQSRFYYLRKNFGVINAIWAESILRFSKYTAMLIGIVVLGIFLLAYKLPELMPFIGDQGWFYLSARDMLTSGAVPLVGIASSHPWLHQGPFWTYLLAGAFSLSQFNPISGAYLSIILGIGSILLLYKISSQMFSSRVGIIAAVLFASSPLVIMNFRMPYHTAPIPLFTILFMYALYQWVEGRRIYLPVTITLLAILYNFQIATFLLTIVFLIIAGYGLFKRKEWFMHSFTTKNIILSMVGFLVPMLPMLLYDIGHGFPQTLLFLAWIAYKIATVFGYPSLHHEIQNVSMETMLLFIADFYKRLIYLADNLVAFTIALFSFGFFVRQIIKRVTSKQHNGAEYILGLLIFTGLLGIIATKTTSGAYLPILFPTVILVTALFFDKLIVVRPRLAPVVFVIIGIITFMNAITLVNQNYFIGKGASLADKIQTSKEIVSTADGRSYNLIGKGEGSQFESYTMNYQYLTWWLGNEPSTKPESLKFIILEDNTFRTYD